MREMSAWPVVMTSTVINDVQGTHAGLRPSLLELMPSDSMDRISG